MAFLKNKIEFIIIAFFLLLNPSTGNTQSTNLNGFDLRGSSILIDEIRRGGPPRDGIPSIDTPEFLNAKKADFPNEEDRVLGVFLNDIAKAYPIGILNYHEIVNDFFGSDPVVITYCPLCGSGIAFHSKVQGKPITFGVSGLLYNSDVLLYDRETHSLWSQMMNQAVTGPAKGESLKIVPTSNTTWKDWKDRYPETLVLSKNTGFQRDYTQTPYTGYDQSENIYFPVSVRNDSYHPKELVTGIEVEGNFKAYPFSELKKTDGQLIDNIAGVELLIVFDKKNKSARIFDGSGKELPHYTTFWFAWYAFHPNTSVYKAP